jgi:hypothetical protein
MTRKDYLTVACCLAQAFTQCEKLGQTLNQNQANIILAVFCRNLQREREEFNKELFIQSMFEAAASLEQEDPADRISRIM